MRPKMRRFVFVVVAVAVLMLVIEGTARLLQRPNRVHLDGDHPFLLETTWHQVGEYARFVDLDNDAGCWATAISQIGHFHGLTPLGRIEYETTAGSHVSVDLQSYEFRLPEFVPHIEDDTPGISKEQVAKYIYFLSAILHTDFGGSGYLDHETFVERLETHLECDVGFHVFDKEGFLERRDEVTALVRSEIEASRPLMLYFDNGKDFGHAAVIDGCVETDHAFLVHLNMGWGGRHDGWYELFKPFIGVRDDLQTRFLITIEPRNSST